MDTSSIYQSVWRWHFYAGLFVIPFIIILSITGAIYLFKPQLDRWQESDWRGLSEQTTVSPDKQFDAVQKRYPNASFHHYRMNENKNDAAVFHIGLNDHDGMRDVYVSPNGKVLASINPENKISNFVSRLHGTLLIGKWGRYLVELAASWSIIMIITGFYLWWPRGKNIFKSLWPRLHKNKKIFWKEIHAVTGAWVAGFVLILLLSGLPWTEVWSSGFNKVRTEMGWVNIEQQDWHSGGDLITKNQHIEHDHEAMLLNLKQGGTNQDINNKVSLTMLKSIATRQKLNVPIIIKPENAIDGVKELSSDQWTISSLTQNRPLRKNITVEGSSGRIIKMSTFTDRHVIDQIISYGIAWHEGQLFGVINQIIGVITALALIILCFSGIKIWWSRRPDNRLLPLYAPQKPDVKISFKLIIIILPIMLFLPMAALSVIIIIAIESLIKYFSIKIN